MKNWIDIIEQYRQKLNKYWATLIIFTLVTFFTGDSTILQRISYDRQIKRLKSEIDFYTKEKEKNKKQLDAIKSSKESLERYAREQYLMTNPDEELFIISE
ncbi:MAG: septum formation initiator family protein [Dysgonamonadaceae bacterium]|jgi:cell division protein FtsB|nr:septum formation initiator family protein [Dysgonamonadaceae bacterium]